MHAKITAMTMLTAWALVLAPGAARGQFPEYADQDSPTNYVHSGISTSDGPVVSDVLFADLVSAALPPDEPSNELIFAFMQCYGGGMIDELDRTYTEVTYPPVSYTSACRGHQTASAGSKDPATGGSWESYYNFYYSQRIGGALPAPPPPAANTARGAAEYAYDNDYWGPVAAKARGATATENPQYHANSQGAEPGLISMADSNTLHRHNPNNPYKMSRYLAVLWGGSTVDNANWNSLSRIHSDLLARGYTEDEMYIMYPGGAVAGWIDDGTTYQDMIDAWDWVAAHADPLLLTQVFYWGSVNHGTQPQNLPNYVRGEYNEEPQPGKQYYFDLPPDYVAEINRVFHFYDEKNVPEGLPYFEVTAAQLAGDLMVTLNGKPLPLMDVADASVHAEARYFYRFALDAADIAQLSVMGNTCTFGWSGDLDFFSGGLTTGNLVNGIPEPACAALLALGAGAVLSRRRKRL